jgi:hypothetical protein
MRYLFLLSALVMGSGAVVAQGCSDAGFCTIGALKPGQDSSRHSNILSLFFTSGIGDEDVFVFTPAVQYERTLSRALNVQVKLTGNYASGTLGTAAGAGDAYITGIISPFLAKGRMQTRLTVGLKVPLDDSDLSVDGNVLPMQYQSSLGTWDIITGLTVFVPRWQFTVGLQQPVSGENGNAFTPSGWTGDEDASRYPPSRNLVRKADVLARAIYSSRVGKRVAFTAGLLGIYHTDDDTYTEVIPHRHQVFIRGSSGLTLNVTGGLSFMVNEKWKLGLTTGLPFVVRDLRPDGLTRSIVLSPELVYRW